MISRRQYVYHSILNATVLALAIGLGAILTITKCSGPQSALPSGGNVTAGFVHVEGIPFAGRDR